MRLKKYLLLSAFILLLYVCGNPILAQGKRDPIRPLKVKLNRDTLDQSLNDLVPLLIDSADVTGLALAVIQGNHILWSGGFGVKNAETGESITDTTIFEAASLGKPVFAYGVMKLVDQGLLDLDTPVCEYGEYEDVKHLPDYMKITARMILTHTSGLPNWRKRGDRLHSMFPPGDRFSYSGEGFVYLQNIIEQITGQSINKFMEEFVFVPLRMMNSSYVWEDRFEKNHAIGHNATGKSSRKGKPEKPKVASSLHTNVVDYAKFLVAVLNGIGLSEKSIKEMMLPQVILDPTCVICKKENEHTDFTDVSWGLGWGLQIQEQGKAFWHWGDNDNFKGYTVTLMDPGIGLVYFSNSFNGLALRNRLVTEILGGAHPAFEWVKYDQYNSIRKQLQKKLEKVFLAEGPNKGVQLYETLKEQDLDGNLDESFLAEIGFTFMSAEENDLVIEVFKLNAREYPKSWRVYDCLGLAYMVNRQNKLSIEYYKKSLEMNPQNVRAKNTIKMLENLPGVK